MNYQEITEQAFLDELEKIGGFLGDVEQGWGGAGQGLAMGQKAGLKSPGLWSRMQHAGQMVGGTGMAKGMTLGQRFGGAARVMAKPLAIAGGIGAGVHVLRKAFGGNQQQQQR